MFRTLFGFGRKNRRTQRRVRAPKAVRRKSWKPLLEDLEARWAPAVSVTYNPDFKTLDAIAQDTGPNFVTVEHPDSDHTTVNGQQVPPEALRIRILDVVGGHLTVNIRGTEFPVYVNDETHGGTDTINVGGNWVSGVRGIFAPLYLENGPSFNTINVDDSRDQWNRTVTLDNPPSPFGESEAWGRITGLTRDDVFVSAPIYYECPDTSNLNIYTYDGSNGYTGAANNVLVNSTRPVPLEGAITVYDGLGTAIVAVGKNDSVQDIQGKLRVSNASILNVSDLSDGAFRTVTLDTVTEHGQPWSRIKDLAPAPIMYQAAYTGRLKIDTGGGGAAVKVESTSPLDSYVGDAIYLTGHGSGNDTVNVGKAGSVENVRGILRIDNVAGGTAISVDNSLYTGSRHKVILDTDGGYGLITDLFPSQTIVFKQSHTRSLAIDTGQDGADVSVRRTGQLLNNGVITVTGHNDGDTVTVGYPVSIIQNDHQLDLGRSVQDIKGSLMVSKGASKPATDGRFKTGQYLGLSRAA
jgi:hypothetical protein